MPHFDSDHGSKLGRLQFINVLSYKGLSWIYKSSTIVGGRKTATKEFINTDRQKVEDLGKRVRGHSIKGCVALLGDEDNYPEKRDALLASLETEGVGTLIHPMYGIIENAIVVDYVFNEGITHVGIGQLTVNFEISNTDGEPKVEDVTDETVIQQFEDVLSIAGSTIIETWLADANLLGVYEDARAKVEEISDKITSAISFVTTVGDELADIAAEFQDDILLLASSAQALADSVKNVVAVINATVATAAAVFEVLKEFFSFGFITDIEFSFDTAANNKSKENNRVINNAINNMVLAAAYVAVIQKDYNTIDELQSDIGILETQLAAIKDAPDMDQTLLGVTLDARAAFFAAIKIKKPTISTIIEIETTLVSARSLSYQYYGNDSEAEDITSINGGFGLIYSGNVKIFSV